MQVWSHVERIYDAGVKQVQYKYIQQTSSSSSSRPAAAAAAAGGSEVGTRSSFFLF